MASKVFSPYPEAPVEETTGTGAGVNVNSGESGGIGGDMVTVNKPVTTETTAGETTGTTAGATPQGGGVNVNGDESGGGVVSAGEKVTEIHDGESSGTGTGATPRAQAKPEPSVWDKGFREGYKTMPDKSIAEAIIEFNNEAKRKGKAPMDILEMWMLMHDKDITKSAAENEADEKKRASKEKWERTANVLSHLGNFIGALSGGPSQAIESSVELTKRQQALRDKTLEQRRQANKDFFTIYQAQQAAERADAKEKREASYQQESLLLKKAQEERMRDALALQEMKLKWQIEYQSGILDIKKKQQEIDEMYKMGLLTYRGRQLALQELKANYTETKTDKEGNVTTVTRTSGTGGGRSAGSQAGTPAASSSGNGGGQSLGIGLGPTK